MSDAKGPSSEEAARRAPPPEGTPATLARAELTGPRRHGRAAFAAVFALACALFLATVLPVGAPILLGCLLAAFAAPLRVRIERRFPGRSVAAASVTLAIVLVVAVPLVLLTLTVIERITRVVRRAPALLEWLGPEGGLSAFLADKPTLRRLVPPDLGAEISSAASAIGSFIPTLLSGFFQTALAIFLTLVTTYYLLRDGRWMLARLEQALPLEPRHTRAIIDEFQGVGRGVILGTLGTAFTQGVVAGLGYWALGLPEPLLLGALTFVASPIPVVGSGLVWVPAAIALFASGDTTRGVILLAFGVLVVGMLDNVLRPYLTRRGLHVHPLLVFLGLFGGILAFGPAGVFLGPLFVALFVALARIYEREMAPGAAALAGAREPEKSLGATLKAVLGRTILKRQP